MKHASPHPTDYDLLVIGGGLAGLTAALRGRHLGLRVALVDLGQYPRHRVCGEYVSQEVVSVFRAMDIDLHAMAPPVIDRFLLTSPQGKQVRLQLPLGGLGLSRHAFDHYLYQIAVARGVDFFLREKVTRIQWQGEACTVTAQSGSQWQTRAVISAHGKRSSLDRTWQRPFFRQRSPYLGVKFHAEWDMPEDLVELHNFQAGYCGVSKIEDGRVNICYLTTRDHLRRHGSVEAMEAKVLHRNPHLAEVLQRAERVWAQPLVINEVSFAAKAPVEQGMLMAGDAAGLIAPLCGNGMAMAIQAGNLAALCSSDFLQGRRSRAGMEQQYAQQWRRLFRSRLWVGRQAQAMFRQEVLAEISVRAMGLLPSVARWVIRQTHG